MGIFEKWAWFWVFSMQKYTNEFRPIRSLRPIICTGKALKEPEFPDFENWEWNTKIFSKNGKKSWKIWKYSWK
jgi:hypothetical protein